ncbi:MAG: hypothetical protein R6X02_26875 [Enhygromyxa sp.]
MPRTPLAASLLVVLGCALGCPAKAPTPQSEAQAGRSPAGVPVTDADDPRVVRDSDDLYATEDAPRQPPSTPALGSGRPDTSNGVCKLFSPKLPEPECCPQETGFDAEKVKQLCGHALYMGESLQQSCGYYYLPEPDGGIPVALRASRLNLESVSEAAAAHDERLAHTLRLPKFESTPVPGVEGALWSEHDGVHWAFVPGWSSVRLVSWTDDACPIEAMPAVLKLMIEAKEVPPEAPRPGLLPIARQ